MDNVSSLYCHTLRAVPAGKCIMCFLCYTAEYSLCLVCFSSGPSVASEKGKENMAEISLICEENLLDTIFHACDTQRRGTAVCARTVISQSGTSH